MSFGSQSEPAFRAYAEAAKAINILCVNGEGGEIRDMYGRFRKWRGQQVASGRFGVSAEMLNASYLAEIKIGQGAKPGEGGHLPGKKVSEKVAAARNATPGTDLISPSNNHDLYSIEDLAELIDELKTVNPDLRVSVKVPVVPNIGTIGLGIAKAGADIITLSGFEGGTGAARQHALRHVGLPSDIGTRLVHRALMEAGIRNRVEIWADGGYRHAHDVVKLICMGANRIGFGTLAMVSLGCTICRGCQLDTCHVGIATQIETTEEATEHGLKKFTPQEVARRRRELRPLLPVDGRGGPRVVAELGYERAQDLVGRYDLLEQVARRAARPRRADHPARGVPRPRAGRPPARSPTERCRPRRAPRPGWSSRGRSGWSRKEASAEIAALAADGCRGEPVRCDFQRPTDAHDRVLGTELAGAIARARIYDDAPEGEPDDVLAELSSTAARSPARGSARSTPRGSWSGSRAAPRTASARRCSAAPSRSSRARAPTASGSTARSASHSPTALSAAACSSRVRPTRASASACRAPTWCSAASPPQPLDDSRGCVSDRANAKGFAFEYMTSGRAVVLGDIGPWACAGMTGGRVYCRVNPEWNLDRERSRAASARGRRWHLRSSTPRALLDVQDLLGHYAAELRATDQAAEAERIIGLAAEATEHFLMIVPERVQADPNISTE